MVEEFKEFAMRGNVIDMSIGVIIGTAFGKIVDSLVTDIMMPPLGVLMGNVNMSNLFINLSNEEYKTLAEAEAHGAATINYGEFLDSIFHFAIISFATFVTIKQMNKLRKLPSDAISKKSCPYCTTDIPNRATRCPQCTSILEGVEDIDESSRLATPKITIKAG
ncbi:large conductance mechanosensitive channel protein MscL [Salirhabdus euzebyi]|uniref:large conductance mechanosensitive channel protein MscL n=1 Tax=Salirhabdus euzebyi TaxID=394506 RepID=UPI00157B6AEF|nr:large conductance mechanosensitive channel protein MscL [Salirhabdus euzebyi]